MGHVAHAHHAHGRQFIVNLRKNFEVDPARPKHFLSVRGAGYRFVANAAAKLPLRSFAVLRTTWRSVPATDRGQLSYGFTSSKSSGVVPR